MELSDSIKYNNIHIIGVPEEDREKGAEVYLTKLYLKVSLIWGQKQPSESRNQRELPSKLSKAGQHQDTVVQLEKYRDKGKSPESSKGKDISVL